MKLNAAHYRFEHRRFGVSVRVHRLLHPSLVRSQPPTADGARRSAFTLLEVILALSILAGAVAVLGELIRLGLLNADAARQLTRAEMLCESIADQIDAGAIAANAVSNTPCDDDPRFLYSVNVNQANQTGLLSIEVTVARDLPEQQHPQKFTLTRWIIDPGVEEQQMSSEQQTAADQATAAAAATGGSSPSGSSSTGTGS